MKWLVWIKEEGRESDRLDSVEADSFETAVVEALKKVKDHKSEITGISREI